MKDESSSGLVIFPYNLADAEFLSASNAAVQCLVWVPVETVVVIGRGSRVEQELRVAEIVADGVPVLQRATGGCAVVLTPDMLCVSIVIRSERQRPSADYFSLFLGMIIQGLERAGVSELSHRGISDIALGPKKIAGTALYRNRERVFFHGVINVAGSTLEMEKYLLHPPRTPDYRVNRSHRDFVTSLYAEGFALSSADLGKAIAQEFDRQKLEKIA